MTIGGKVEKIMGVGNPSPMSQGTTMVKEKVTDKPFFVELSLHEVYIVNTGGGGPRVTLGYSDLKDLRDWLNSPLFDKWVARKKAVQELQARINEKQGNLRDLKEQMIEHQKKAHKQPGSEKRKRKGKKKKSIPSTVVDQIESDIANLSRQELVDKLMGMDMTVPSRNEEWLLGRTTANGVLEDDFGDDWNGNPCFHIGPTTVAPTPINYIPQSGNTGTEISNSHDCFMEWNLSLEDEPSEVQLPVGHSNEIVGLNDGRSYQTAVKGPIL